MWPGLRASRPPLHPVKTLRFLGADAPPPSKPSPGAGIPGDALLLYLESLTLPRIVQESLEEARYTLHIIHRGHLGGVWTNVSHLSS